MEFQKAQNNKFWKEQKLDDLHSPISKLTTKLQEIRLQEIRPINI